ncbi:MAG: hypothetical protein OJF47_001905 [Nitrospira sp.]|nr:MAG: hypothetical protein OJF47_001905 [Nitrospira sp.]
MSTEPSEPAAQGRRRWRLTSRVIPPSRAGSVEDFLRASLHRVILRRRLFAIDHPWEAM